MYTEINNNEIQKKTTTKTTTTKTTTTWKVIFEVSGTYL